MRFRTENTIFEWSQALVGDFELERVDKLGQIIQNRKTNLLLPLQRDQT